MIEYISGRMVELNPAYIVVEAGGIGYLLNISVNSFAALGTQEEVHLLVHEVIREDTHQLYGFATGEERRVFRHLISVSGIGPNTARMMLSSLTANEVSEAISTSNVNVLKAVKGIGLKTAQRIIVDLAEKVGRGSEETEIFAVANNTSREEALSALVMLGFARNASLKLIDKLMAEQKGITVEELVKQALRNL